MYGFSKSSTGMVEINELIHFDSKLVVQQSLHVLGETLQQAVTQFSVTIDDGNTLKKSVSNMVLMIEKH